VARQPESTVQRQCKEKALRVIGVLDLRSGRAVHARAGQRAAYRPVSSVTGIRIDPGDALALARAYIDRLGLVELYVADLDAILGDTPQQLLVARLATLGVSLWLDAGISSVDQAHGAVASGATHVIVGLETLSSFESLAEICTAVGAGSVAFSLDLRDREPVRSPGGDPTAPAIAARAAAAGAAAMIVLDLARVGTGRGPDLDVIADIRQAAPDVILLAGGGVRGLKDLERLAETGCDGALVATALHDGRIGTDDVAAALKYKPRAAWSERHG
jgi:phosphoribosylformimino-5-aminoimidazole carboxamide ribotide isomerase